jgi:hypothetical protein
MRDLLNRYTLKVLKKEISKNNIKGYSKMRKKDVIDLMLKNKSKFSHLMKKEKYNSKTEKKPKPTPKPAPKPEQIKKGKEALISRPMRKTRPKSKPKKEKKKPEKSQFEKNMAKMGINVSVIKRKPEKKRGNMTFEDFKKYFDNRYNKNFSEEKLLKLRYEDPILQNKRSFNSYFKNIIEASEAYSYATNTNNFVQKIVDKDRYAKARKANPEFFKKLDEEKARKKEMEKFSNRGLKKIREFLDKKGFKYKMSERSVKKLKYFYINNSPINLQ